MQNKNQRKAFESLKNKRICVLGSGESGTSAIRLLHHYRITPSCSTSGRISPAVKKILIRSGADFEENGHTKRFLQKNDIFITSPGILPKSPALRLAQRNNIKIISEIELASRFLQGPWIGVTGTNGKTTTSSLIAKFIGSKQSCDLCGNIGKSVSRSILDSGPSRLRIVELSSFQLEYSEQLKPNLAVFLNLKPNHLNWHTHKHRYYRAKLKLAR